MQQLNISITVEYRSDGPVNKAAAHTAICELLLKQDREALFKNGATYAGYTVALQQPARRKAKP